MLFFESLWSLYNAVLFLFYECQTFRFMKYLYASILCVCFALIVTAQNGYSLNVKFSKVNQDSLNLSVYGGTTSKSYTIESLSTNQKKATFFQDQKIIGGIYQLQFKGAEKNDYINIVMDNGANISLTITGDDLKKITSSDPLNTLFIQAQNTYNVEQRKSLFMQILEQFPSSVASLYAQLELKELELQSLSQDSEIRRDFRDKYFENIDLNDKRIPLLPNIYSSLFQYVKILPINNENYIQAIDHLLEGQNCDSRNFQFYLEWAFMNIEYLNRYNLYDSFLHTFNTYLNKSECIVKDEKFYKSIVKNLQNYEKVPIGSTLPDFKMVSKEGKESHISDIYPDHDYTFIAFYDPDCSHCKKKMPEITEFFNTLDSPYDIHQVAFLNAHSDYAWEYFIKEKKLTGWEHVKSEDKSLQYIKDLDVFANPAFFLVDREGKIIMKKYIPEEMLPLFKTKQ